MFYKINSGVRNRMGANLNEMKLNAPKMEVMAIRSNVISKMPMQNPAILGMDRQRIDRTTH